MACSEVKGDIGAYVGQFRCLGFGNCKAYSFWSEFSQIAGRLSQESSQSARIIKGIFRLGTDSTLPRTLTSSSSSSPSHLLAATATTGSLTVKLSVSATNDV